MESQTSTYPSESERSRLAVRDAFAQVDMSTHRGLFSALVFCLITFNMPDLCDTPEEDRIAVFDDAASWKAYLNYLEEIHGPQKAKFLCGPNAFKQQWQGDRVVGNAALYWEAAANAEWPTLFTEGRATFKECFAALETLAYETESGSKKTPPLLRGTLSRYLICTDLVYAGAIAMPTVNSEAELIHELNSGAIKGLRFLGYCPPERLEDTVRPKGKSGEALQNNTKKPRKARPPTREAVLVGFQNFYEDVDSMLTEEEKKSMGWDVLVAEHTLCKVSRLTKFWDTL